jgi:hypothetical protein
LLVVMVFCCLFLLLLVGLLVVVIVCCLLPLLWLLSVVSYCLGVVASCYMFAVLLLFLVNALRWCLLLLVFSCVGARHGPTSSWTICANERHLSWALARREKHRR